MSTLYFLLAIIATCKSLNINLIEHTMKNGNGSSQLRKLVVKMARSVGPTRIGRILGKMLSDKCTVPGEGGDEIMKSFDPKEIIITALDHHGPELKVIEYKVVCLNQGRQKYRHTSASVIVKYSIKKLGESITTVRTDQLSVVCLGGIWKSAFFDISPLVGNLSTLTRHDCQMCPFPRMFPSVHITPAEHCLGKCLLSCN